MVRVTPPDLPAGADPESTWSNPAKLSCKVRELAYRSHRAVTAHAQPHVTISPGTVASRQESADLLNELVRLQRKIHSLSLRCLVPWIDALIRQVEAQIRNTEAEAHS